MKKKRKANKSKARALLTIVKRKGHSEIYDERKVYGSCYFACRNAHLSEEESEDISNKVCKSIKKEISKKKSITSNDIFRLLASELKKHNEDASFLYETHRDIS